MKMRHYIIYLIEDEFAEYFYGRENKFIDLFLSERQCQGEITEIVKKQIDYITKPLPHLNLHRYFLQCVHKKDINIKGKKYCLATSNKGGAELTINERSLYLNAWGSYNNESAFFEMLRVFDGQFFAMCMDHDNYGWVKPIKTRKLV